MFGKKHREIDRKNGIWNTYGIRGRFPVNTLEECVEQLRALIGSLIYSREIIIDAPDRRVWRIEAGEEIEVRNCRELQEHEKEQD